MSQNKSENIPAESSRLTQNQMDLHEGLHELHMLRVLTLPELQEDPVNGHVYQNERLTRSINTANSALAREFIETLEPDQPPSYKFFVQMDEPGEESDETPDEQTLAGEAYYDLWNIIAGMNPITGEDLDEEHPFRDVALLRGFRAALSSLKKERAQRGDDPAMSRSGQGWNEEEADDLLDEYDSGLSIPEIAQKHRRGCLAIMIKLKRYRDIRPDLWGAYGK